MLEQWGYHLGSAIDDNPLALAILLFLPVLVILICTQYTDYAELHFCCFRRSMNISRCEGHRYAFEIHQYMNGIRLLFAVCHNTQSGAFVSMTRAYACAKAHH